MILPTWQNFQRSPAETLQKMLKLAEENFSKAETAFQSGQSTEGVESLRIVLTVLQTAINWLEK
jgi:hypothetical protein